jgi:arsenate reductase
VITMGCGANVCPIVPKQTEEWRIEDPAGKSITKFREVRNEIKKKVEKLVKTLKKKDM